MTDQPNGPEGQPSYGTPGQMPPPPPGYGQVPQQHAQPGFAHQYSQPAMQYVQVPVVAAPPNAGGAVASMVLGIVSLFIPCFGWITGIIAIALGGKAMKEINESRGQRGGRGMAITGLVLGIISLAIYLPWMVFWLFAAAGSGAA